MADAEKHNEDRIVRTTLLEMCKPPANYPSLQTRSALAIMAAPEIPLNFYRFLYNEVGKEHFWFLRRNMSDDELAGELHAKNIVIKILYHDGAPVGFAEIDVVKMPVSIDIVYFGLMPQFIGRGLGKWFLGQIVHLIWEMEPDKIFVSTTSLDHAHALPTYQKLGFTPVSFTDRKMQDWLGNW